MRDHELSSPVDLPGEPIEGSDPLGWTVITIGVAALVLLFANAGTLSAWVDEKPPTPFQQQVSEQANRWTALMDMAGVTTPRRTLHEAWKRAQAARFGEEAPAGTQ